MSSTKMIFIPSMSLNYEDNLLETVGIGGELYKRDTPLIAKNQRLNAENTKLRELAAQMGKMLDCVICDRNVECNWQSDGLCWYEIELRELGVEVENGD